MIQLTLETAPPRATTWRILGIAGSIMIATAIITSTAEPARAAPNDPNDSCEELTDPALDETVITTVSGTGVTVSWSYTAQPSYARACVWTSGTQDANGIGVIDRRLDAGTTTRFFSWADFGLDQSPCVESPGSLFRGGVHIENITLSRRGTFANCPVVEPTPTPSQEPTESPSEDPTESPTDDPTAPPSEDPTAPPSEDPTPTPTGSVLGATGAPATTLPPTDAMAPESGSLSAMVLSTVGALALLSAGLLYVTPGRTKPVRKPRA